MITIDIAIEAFLLVTGKMTASIWDTSLYSPFIFGYSLLLRLYSVGCGVD